MVKETNSKGETHPTTESPSVEKEDTKENPVEEGLIRAPQKGNHRKNSKIKDIDVC